MFSALSFVIMMFNVPLPGGTTGHAVGAAIAAIVLGPWAAILAVSMALIIQALFFGDGGILALGANIFNMGIAMPLTSYLLYTYISKYKESISWKVISGFIAGYIAINVSALLTGVELGIQPLLFRDAAGHALYFPYPLKIAIPAMAIGHLTVAGFAEGILTAVTLRWIIRTQPDLLQIKNSKVKIQNKNIKINNKSNSRIMGLSNNGFIGLLLLIVLTPLGLLAPGTAWGEWGREELLNLGLGFIPEGFDRWSTIWHAPIPDYALKGLPPAIVYIASALFGVLILFLVFYLPYWILRRRK